MPTTQLHFPPLPPSIPSLALQVFPREYRRAMDEAAKLKAAQAAEAELLKEVGQWGLGSGGTGSQVAQGAMLPICTLHCHAVAWH